MGVRAAGMCKSPAEAPKTPRHPCQATTPDPSCEVTAHREPKDCEQQQAILLFPNSLPTESLSITKWLLPPILSHSSYMTHRDIWTEAFRRKCLPASVPPWSPVHSADGEVMRRNILEADLAWLPNLVHPPLSILSKEFVAVWSLSHIQLFASPWNVAHQAPLSMGFSRQKYWSGLPFPPSGDFPYPGIKPTSLALQAESTTEPPGKTS